MFETTNQCIAIGPLVMTHSHTLSNHSPAETWRSRELRSNDKLLLAKDFAALLRPEASKHTLIEVMVMQWLIAA